MELDLEQNLRLVEQELHQVQDQIQTLLQHQESLLEQQAELQSLLATSREENNEPGGTCKSSQEDWSGSFEWDKLAADLRLNIFGIKSYRRNQLEIINAVMSGRDVIVIMAAGGGKSLCYQLPALLRSGTALVVSPLLSLIHDQVMGLTALGIAASMLTSTTTKEEEKAIYIALEKGEGDLRILYVTPEKVAKSKRFVSKLEKCNRAGCLSLIAIDEAHCCSQWGHDFRPDYKNLGILKKQFPKVPMIALTVLRGEGFFDKATATERVQTDLREMLQITRCEKFISTVNRPNLFYEVREKKSNGNAAIDDIAEFILDNFPRKESGIVYCFSRKECEQVAAELRKRGISSSHYHADMGAEARSSVHTRWTTNKLQVIVGTVAFGMGINKPDVRFVIHHSLSKSLETYYQESGRAGRDGLPAHCLLYFRPADLPRQMEERLQISYDLPAKKPVQFPTAKSAMVFAEVAGLHNLYAICRFCQSKRACRRAAFFRHFGEKIQKCNGMCDNCAFSKEIVDMDVTEHAKSLVTLVKESYNVDQKSTMLQLVDLWRSQARKSDADAQLSKDLSKDDVERVIIQLILDGFLNEEFSHTAYATNAYVNMGTGWRGLLQGQRKVKLEIVQGVQSAKKGSKANNVGREEGKMQTGMGIMLDQLRQNLATAHGGIFPHSVLSSQHITLLCKKKPVTVEQLEEVVGKRIAGQYGKELVEAMKKYMEQNLDDSTQSGPWVTPKGKRPLEGTPSTAPKTPSSRFSSQKPSTSKKLPAAKSKKEIKQVDVIVPPKSSDCIDLDSDSDQGEGKPAAINGTKVTQNHGGDEIEESDDDDDFALFKRVKR